MEEVELTLRCMKKNKATGPDGVTTDIFLHHWVSAKDDFLVVILDFFKHKRMLKSFNHTFLTIIPKEVDNHDLGGIQAHIMYEHTLQTHYKGASKSSGSHPS